MTAPRIEYDELALFHENASEYAIEWNGPPVVARTEVEVAPGRRVSALVWGTASPQIVFVHGGAQNAHTWDTVALALGRPALAVDLPGHGHSDWRDDLAYSPVTNAEDVAIAVEALAPQAAVVVGMSLGRAHVARARGAAARPRAKARAGRRDSGRRPRQGEGDHRLRERAADVPELRRHHEAHDRAQPDAHRGVVATRHPPQRAASSTTARGLGATTAASARSTGDLVERIDTGPLWDDVSSLTMPLVLARGALSPVVDDNDVAELKRRQPNAEVVVFEGAGHSIQGDKPIELAELIERFVFA